MYIVLCICTVLHAIPLTTVFHLDLFHTVFLGSRGGKEDGRSGMLHSSSRPGIFVFIFRTLGYDKEEKAIREVLE